MIKILGIDPGSSRIGYGFIEAQGRQKLKIGEYGTLEIKSESQEKKLVVLEENIRNLINRLNPDLIALETLYFSKNKKTALEVAEARGVIILVAAKLKKVIKQYSPNQVKSAAGGYGRADKKAVAFMVQKILGVPKIIGLDDASDALAVAITSASYGF